ncbi:YdjY domain-containing protein [Luteolibacter algae]|uniref:YdjY domain-containing protein n=1 Tax=Luteolibacter algae TaxID=454151 RepID=A0ABW5DBI5_9BACT
MPTIRLFFLLLLLQLQSPAQEAGQDQEKVQAPERPIIEQIDANQYRIGTVTFDKKSREIRFPAQLNMREGLLEYLLVHQNGKIHEALFRTETSPTNINLAFTLLRYKPSRELYRIPREPGVLSNDFYKEDEATRAAARIAIDVEYTIDGETKRFSVNEWISHGTTGRTMPLTHWVYGGSEFYEGQYVPETTGDLAAIFITNASIINYPGEDNGNDDVWTVFTRRVPPLETNVTLIVSPYKEP